ncbi:hypothetical protein SRHO_G00270910 [Serrasalmus rhombeus]
MKGNRLGTPPPPSLRVYTIPNLSHLPLKHHSSPANISKQESGGITKTRTSCLLLNRKSVIHWQMGFGTNSWDNLACSSSGTIVLNVHKQNPSLGQKESQSVGISVQAGPAL